MTPDMILLFISYCSNANIGHPKLFMGGEESPAESSPEPTVNNCVAANLATALGWPGGFISGYSFERFSRTGGSGLRTFSRFNDFELY